MQSLQEMLDNAHAELTTLREQGCDTWEPARELALVRFDSGPEGERRLRRLCERMGGLRPEPGWPYLEPDDLEGIRAVRAEGPRRIARGLADGEAADRLAAAWTGRVAGCMLGRPVAGWPRNRIIDTTKYWGQYPLCDYFAAPPEGLGRDWPHPPDAPFLRGNIRGGLQHPVTDASVACLGALESCGPAPTSADLARHWLAVQPYGVTERAERAAYRNLVAGVEPPETSLLGNPWRESSQAMRRADLWGYACPGRPELAAGLAFRDGCITNRRNGLYAGMWLAAMAAAAFAAGDPRQVLEVGLSEIPAGCRLAEAVRGVLQWRQEDETSDRTVERVLATFRDYGQWHAIPNAAVVAAALAWCDGDFTRALGIAVGAGLETAANAAAVGSICGLLAGCAGIPARWKEPLADRLETAVPGDVSATLSGLAARTAAVRSRLAAADGLEPPR